MPWLEILLVTIVVAIALVGFGFAREFMPSRKEGSPTSRDRYCIRCGTTGRPKTITKGHFVLEVVLWLCFLLPGLIYSIWRLASRYSACAACQSAEIVPLDSPRARAELGVKTITGGQQRKVS